MEKQRQVYRDLMKDFGVEVEVGAVTASVTTSLVEEFIYRNIDTLKGLALGLVGTVAGGVAGGMAVYVLLRLMGRGEERAQLRIVEMAVKWKGLDEELRHLVAARLALEMGMDTEEGRRVVYEGLEGLLGTDPRRLEEKLREHDADLERIRGDIADLRKKLEEEREERLSEGAEDLMNLSSVRRYLGIPDEIDAVLVDSGEVKQYADEILSGLRDGGVFVITGEPGAGKTTLLYVAVRELLRDGRRVFGVNDLGAFKPLEFTELQNSFAILDVTGPKVAEALVRKLEGLDTRGLKRLVIAIRSSYMADDKIRDALQEFHVLNLKYDVERTLPEIAERRLRQVLGSSGTGGGLSDEEMAKIAKRIAEKSEGVPLYASEAAKMLGEADRSSIMEIVEDLPRGIKGLIERILREETTRDCRNLVLYYLLSNAGPMPEYVLEELRGIYGVDARYTDAMTVAGGRFYALHSWYRGVIDEILGSSGSGEWAGALRCTARVDTGSPAYKQWEIIERGLGLDQLDRQEDPLAEAIRRFELNLSNERLLDVVDLVMFIAMVNLFNGLAEQGKFNLILNEFSTNLVKPEYAQRYYGLVGYFVSTYFGATRPQGAGGPFYLLSALYFGKIVGSEVAKGVINALTGGSRPRGLTLSALYDEFVEHQNDITFTNYYKAFIRILRESGYLDADERDPFERATFLHIAGRYEEAIEECDAAIRLNPNNPDYHNNKANALDELGKHEEAIEECDAAIRLNPNNPDYHNNKANALDELGKHEEAIEEIWTSTRLALQRGANARFLVRGIIILLYIRKFDEARELIEYIVREGHVSVDAMCAALNEELDSTELSRDGKEFLRDSIARLCRGS
ncbi:tetratricopeptide repeat protein [Conexivisphaera calida]|uniref:TPR repeat-containing protein 03 n=1 Tax=Conexivisphaera calida TaxID=1874277 RepID=A0A4P2VEJ9_9ARCH|nr:tetratricopeptide repeat protein [Conexivisphaera calida]BBE42417.1 TPR repeat-containing protein 03 [Conexivisphaera calida]